jgi:hypothetical protein
MSPLIALNHKQFSYEDAGGPGVLVLALHVSFGRGKTFAKVGEALRPQYRVIAPGFARSRSILLLRTTERFLRGARLAGSSVGGPD